MMQQTQRHARALRILIGSVLIILCTQMGLASAQDLGGVSMSWLLQDSDAYRTHSIIVRFGSTGSASMAGPRTTQSLLTQRASGILPGAKVTRVLSQVVSNLVTIELPEYVSVQDAVMRFNAGAQVLYAEPLYLVRINYTPYAGTPPNDTFFGDQWALNNEGQTGGLPGADINAPEGWEIQANAEEVVVAVLDTGVDYNHPDLYQNMWYMEDFAYPEDANFTDPNSDSYVVDGDPNYIVRDYGPDFITNQSVLADDANDFNEDGDPNDGHFHGTHVAGIVGARGNNEEGISGVAPIVKMMAVRVLDADGVGDITSVVLGFEYVLGHVSTTMLDETELTVRVINCSFEMSGYSSALDELIDAANNANVLVVCAAGNSGMDNDISPVYPANAMEFHDNVVSVMATDHFDNRAYFSNYGKETVHLGAPGENIISCIPQYETAAMAELEMATLYGFLSGTSQAAPHVSGAAALAFTMRPELTAVQMRNRFRYQAAVDKVIPDLCVTDGRLVLDKFLGLMLPGSVINATLGEFYDTIQEAINAASNGHEIVALQGRLYPESIDFLGKAILVRSGDPDSDPDYGEPNVLDTFIAGIDAEESDSLVTFQSGETETSILRGFTIDSAPQSGIVLINASPSIETCIIARHLNRGVVSDGGGATFIDTVIEENQSIIPMFGMFGMFDMMMGEEPSIEATGDGGGVYATGGSNLTFTGCTIRDNQAVYDGGGLFADAGSLLTLTDSSVLTNMTSAGYGGGMSIRSAELVLNDTLVRGNTNITIDSWEGGALYAINATIEVLDSIFSDNAGYYDGGAIYADHCVDVSLTNSQFMGNSSVMSGGALANVASPLTIKNCLFVDNVADGYDAGALLITDSEMSLTNSTFVGNYSESVDARGGVMRLDGGTTAQVADCIFTENDDVAIYVDDKHSTVEIIHSLFHDNPKGDFENAAQGVAVTLDDPNETDEMPGYNNIIGNPMFVTGRLGHYYLSQYEAGQILDVNGVVVDMDLNPGGATSPAVDRGSALATELGMNMLSTRTDNTTDAQGDKDQGLVDIGFHFKDSDSPIFYVIEFGTDPNESEADPNVAEVNPAQSVAVQYTQILLTATVNDPNQNMFNRWENTDDDNRVDRDASGYPMPVQNNVVTATRHMFFAQNQAIVAHYETVEVELIMLVGRGEAGNGRIDEPKRRSFWRRGSVVDLKVTPDDPRSNVEWHNTNDDYATGWTNTVTIEPPFKTDRFGRQTKEVLVEFFVPNTLIVPDQYKHIQEALYRAEPGDIILLKPGVIRYESDEGSLLITKAVTIQSDDPSDPAIVTQTVLDVSIDFIGVEPNTVLNGITIRNQQNNLSGTWPNGNGRDGEHEGHDAGSAYGGAIRFNYASPTVKNCVFTGCIAEGGTGGNGAGGTATDPFGGNGGLPGIGAGGAMAIMSQSNPLIDNCTFSDCQAIGGSGGNAGIGVNGSLSRAGWGGGWSPRWVSPELWESYQMFSIPGPFNLLEENNFYYDLLIFDDWTVEYTGKGGAVFIDRTSSPTLIDCVFTNNQVSAGTLGESPYAWPFTSWAPHLYGGAVHIGEHRELFYFYDFFDPSNPFDFFNPVNYDPINPGIQWNLFPATAQPKFVNCWFGENSLVPDPNAVVEHSMYGSGGCVSVVDGVMPTFEGCTFMDSNAPFGGAISSYDSDSTIKDCEFVGNVGLHGGAVATVEGVTVISGSEFRNNSASEELLTFEANGLQIQFGGVGQGGALWNGHGSLTLTDSVFNQNLASLAGGAIYLNGGDPNDISPILHNCLITNNVSQKQGGGIAATMFASPYISNCTIADNRAVGALAYGGGLYLGWDSDSVLVDSILWNNEASMGSQIGLGSSHAEADPRFSTLTASYSNIDFGLDQVIPDKLDLVICIDTSESMTTAVQTIQTQILTITDTLESLTDDMRVAIVDYRDLSEDPYGDPNLDYPFSSVLAFSSSTADIQRAVASLTIGGDGDVPGTVYSGLVQSLTGGISGIWRPGDDVKRVVLLIGDAEPHDPEPTSNYTFTTIQTLLIQEPSRQIYAIPVGGDVATSSAFMRLAQASGGLLFSSATGSTVVDSILEAFASLFTTPEPFFLGHNSQLVGWDQAVETWDPNQHNISEDPNFVMGYYLSQIEAGQLITSSSVDAGSADVNRLPIRMDTYTTRTGGTQDMGRVDLGYHYRDGLAQQWLTAEVLPGDDGLLHGSITPDKLAVFSELQDNMIIVTAIPDPGYKVKVWTGTDDDETIRAFNTVTVDTDKYVSVTFEPAARFYYQAEIVDSGDGPHGALSPTEGWVDEGTTVVFTAIPDDGFEVKQWINTDDDASLDTMNTVLVDANNVLVRVEFTELTKNVLTVPSDYTTIQAAVAAAIDGDTIVVDPGVYQAGENGYLMLLSKAITITSRFPSDPCSVSNTVLDGYANDPDREFANMGILIAADTDNRTVLNGLTIRHCGGAVNTNVADDGDRDAGHPDGYDGQFAAGSALIVLPNASPLIKNCIFENNFIIAQDGGNGENADDTSNAGRGGWGGWARGGAIYCASNSSPTFVNCRVVNNFAQGGNGGNGGDGADNDTGDTLPNYGGNYTPGENVYIDPNSLNVEVVDQELWTLWTWDYASTYKFALSEDAISDVNLVFALDVLGAGGPYMGDERDYTAFGGGVYCGTSSQVSFIHCEFRGNRTYGGLTGIGGLPDEADRNIEPLYTTELPSFGGGVFCDTDSLVTFDGCTFAENVVSSVVDANGVNANAVNIENRPNPYMGYGGGVSTDTNARVFFADCNFIDNLADLGGGIYVKDSLADVIDSNFIRNSALQGGAFAGTGGDIIIADCNVVACVATDDIDDPNDDDILPLGAGIYLSSCPAQVTDSNFFSNSTPGSGGAIYIRGNKPTITNCLFRNNGAGHDGGALSINHFAVATIRNSTFYHNLSDPNILGGTEDMGYGGALFCGSKSRTFVTDSIFFENQAHLGGEFAVMFGSVYNDECATLTLAYSTITTGPNDVYTECDTLVYGEKVLWGVNPQFRVGPLGSHYLASNSSAVDAGSTTSYAAGMITYTTQIDPRKDTPDTGTVDIGYHYKLAEPCRACDLVKDGSINTSDLDRFTELAQEWMSEICHAGNNWCDGADLSYDGSVDDIDRGLIELCQDTNDVTPPSPNPSKWSVQPYLDDNQARMVAKVAEDGWWLDQVEYYFQNISGNGHDSNWQASPVYVDNIGSESDAYGYRFKVRDPAGNETQWSKIKHASPGINIAPVGPLSLSLLEAGVTYLQLLAEQLFDVDGVQYYMEIGDEDYDDSGWFDFDPNGLVVDPNDPNNLIVLDPNDPNMAGPNFRFTQLEPSTTYRFRIKARDKSDDQLETGYSDWFNFTTLDANELLPPTPNPLTWSEDDVNGFDGTPRSTLIETTAGFEWFGVTMTCIVADDVDSPPVEYYFQCSEGAWDSDWIIDPTYTTLRVGGRMAAEDLWFRVRARDQSGNMTQWNPWFQVTGGQASGTANTNTNTGNTGNTGNVVNGNTGNNLLQ